MTRYAAVWSLRRGVIDPPEWLSEENQLRVVLGLGRECSRKIRVRFEGRGTRIAVIEAAERLLWFPGHDPSGHKLPISTEPEGAVRKMMRAASKARVA